MKRQDATCQNTAYATGGSTHKSRRLPATSQSRGKDIVQGDNLKQGQLLALRLVWNSLCLQVLQLQGARGGSCLLHQSKVVLAVVVQEGRACLEWTKRAAPSLRSMGESRLPRQSLFTPLAKPDSESRLPCDSRWRCVCLDPKKGHTFHFRPFIST